MKKKMLFSVGLITFLPFLVFFILYSYWFNGSLLVDNNNWALFFTMISGVGAVSSPLATVLTIYYLNNQSRMEALERVAELNRTDLFQELKSATDMAIDLVSEKYSAGLVANEVQKLLVNVGLFNPQVSNSYDVSLFQDVKLNLSNGKELFIYNNSDFGAWLTLLLEIQESSSIRYIANSKSYFGARVRNIIQQCDLAFLYAEKCRESGVDGQVVQLRLNRISEIYACVKKAELFLE
ncbi:hypothetical protein PWG14_26540 [Chromobacterium amazonense]|uniref:hypothetical protein n=1 Tax=Chromobacterium amazonense TaxID=1382803 RepID=UPI00237E8ED9|nr:hypothetical protein [Chromobacterium amazonense]MDE1716028.1 hypothetical protein [Chromobacterium amazonense]